MEGINLHTKYMGVNQGPDLSVLNSIRDGVTSEKEQLKKISTEFEAIFVTKMLTAMDKTVDRENGLFGEETKFMDNFKSLMFNDIGRQIASNPQSSIGFAKQMYAQMERTVRD